MNAKTIRVNAGTLVETQKGFRLTKTFEGGRQCRWNPKIQQWSKSYKGWSKTREEACEGADSGPKCESCGCFIYAGCDLCDDCARGMSV